MAFSEGYDHQKAWRAGKTPFPLDADGRRRALKITQSAEACFFHLGQALDRLAAAVMIVGGFEVKDVKKVDWGDIEEIADELAAGSQRQRYQPPNTKGRAAQED